ncbi:hypothetical protein IEQ34_018880 [Dendrobium chrysotoxum]|uniref:Uncharacterized protein n=1 Tax=Dendrobium chrysotoxum TaxID=161865 RepID=A0AAV7G5W8_DENCH|nr:hypothetical protein IEQ34_018880 [Dendrobium chrysotoxum]
MLRNIRSCKDIQKNSGNNMQNKLIKILNQLIFKVHNTQKTLARFEEHREMIKNKVSKIPKKHPCCLAGGNELLRFHGTTIACNIGINSSSSLCISEKCRVCQIIRHGFSAKELKGGIGVFITSTSARAID